MTKLTTEITIEELQYRIHAHENDLTQMWTADYFLSVQKELLALKQAAKNPVAWDYEWASYITCDGPQDFNRIIVRESPPDWAIDEGQARNIIPLYAAPVLPKQPELVDLSQQVETLNRILNWILKELPVPTQKSSAMAIRLSSVIDVISDLEVSASAQPVSEPYKFKDAVEDIRNSGVEIDADKINAERDTLNSPVIPDGWKLVPIEPTAAMFHAFNDCDYGRKSMRERYIQMIEAAPAQESE